jgi:hypothetical protein
MAGLTDVSISPTAALHSVARERLAFIGHGQVHDSEIHSDDVADGYLVRLLVRDLDVEKETTVAPPNKLCGRWTLACKMRPLPLAESEIEVLAGVEHRQAGRLASHRENPSVVVDRCWSEGAMVFLGDFQRSAGSGDGSTREVGGETEALSDLAVARLLDSKLVCAPDRAGRLGRPIASVGERDHRGLDLDHLIGRGIDGADNGANESRFLLHEDSMFGVYSEVQFSLSSTGGGASSPGLKLGASAPQVW